MPFLADPPCQNFPRKFLAERGGFEPPIRFNPYTGLANRRLQPLGHLSSNANQLEFAGASLALVKTESSTLRRLCKPLLGESSHQQINLCQCVGQAKPAPIQFNRKLAGRPRSHWFRANNTMAKGGNAR